VRAAPNQKNGGRWVGLTVGAKNGHGGGQKCTGGHSDPGVRGQQTESRVDGGGGDVLGLGAKKWRGEESGTAAGAFERAQARSDKGKRRGSGRCHVGAG
jgi:hypothetical protein